MFLNKKSLLILLCILLCFTAFSQATYSNRLIERYYDYNWKETEDQFARYYSIARNTDSGWLKGDYFASTRKIQMIGLYEDAANQIKNGLFRFYHATGILSSIGRYVHNKKEGLFLEFYSNGILKDSTVYHDGIPIGTSEGWYSNGVAEYQLKVDSSGNGIYTSWFNNSSPSSAGRYIGYQAGVHVPNGRWQYFHKNGKVSSVELYRAGILMDKQYFDEEGSPLGDTILKDHPASFPGGSKAFSKFINSNLYFPSHLDFKNGFTAVVLLDVTIDEDGKVGNVEATLPLHPDIDKIAIEAMKKSPVWLPAINHNRRVPYSFSFPIEFSRSYVAN